MTIAFIIALLLYFWFSTKPTKYPSRDWDKVDLSKRKKAPARDKFDRQTGEQGLTLFLMGEFVNDPNGDD